MRFLDKARTVMALMVAIPMLFLVSCKEKQDEETIRFIVNKLTENSEFNVPPEGGELPLYVVSDLEWAYRFKEAAPDWLQVTDQQVNSNSWMLTLTARENTGGTPRSTILLFTAKDRSCEVTVQQFQEDPVLQVTVPGAYGVEGGDVIFNRTETQISRLTDGSSFHFSLLYPADVRVMTVSVPSVMEKGDTVALSYKIVEKDRTLVKTDYPKVAVLRIREPLVWLKVDENVYFVIKK